MTSDRGTGLRGPPPRSLTGLGNDTGTVQRMRWRARHLGVTTIHEGFEAQARARPDAPAVLLGELRVSYAELNRRANRLAHRLRGVGVAPGRYVPVCAHPSVDALAAILAVLKAGGAYVPLHPDDPQARLDAILEETRPRAILADPARAPRFDAAPILWPGVNSGDAAESNPPAVARGSDAACVAYTSGSTGSPKGVVLEHGGILNKLEWTARDLVRGRPLVIPLLTRLTFAASHRQLFGPWLAGGPVWLLEEDVAQDPLALLRALAEWPAVGLQCVPARWEAMLDAVEAGHAPTPANLRLLCLGGDGTSQALVDRSFAAVPHLELWTVYSATEVGSALAARRRRGDAARLGRPIPGVQVHVLDSQLRPVGPGQIGELHVGGAGVARGYLHRPSLTAQRFLPDPGGGAPGARMFRTGDLARIRLDGELEFVARSERLLKVRGFRVDPNEPEQAIARHPGVKRCVVTASGANGRGRLVAYVVGAGGDRTPGLGELRRFLAGELPDYMIPSALVVLDALPETAAGKVDLRALPQPSRSRGKSARPPGTVVEERLAAIWRDVLGLADVGVDERFEDLGGTSLLAAQLCLAIRDRLGLEIPIAAVFEAPTIERQADLLANREGPGRRRSPLVPVQAEGSRPPVFFVATGLGAIPRLGALAAHLGSERPVYGIRVVGLEAGEQAYDRTEEMAARNLEEIRRVQPAGPYHLLGECFSGLVAFEMARQLEDQGERVGLLGLLDTGAPPPVRRRPRPGGAHEDGRAAARVGVRPRKVGGRARRRLMKRARRAFKQLRELRKRVWRRLRRWGRAGHKRAVGARRDRRLARTTSGPVELGRVHAVRRAQRAAKLAYVARPYPSRLVVFQSDHAQNPRHRAAVEGWEELVAECRREVIGGPHGSLLEEPAVARLATRMAAYLDEAERGEAEGPRA